MNRTNGAPNGVSNGFGTAMTFNDDGAEKSKPGLIRRLFSRAEPEPPTALAEAPAPVPAKRNWLSRLTAGLSRSSASIGQGIVDIFAKRKLDAAALDDLEDL
jgi:fused signal recognition particle receptor